MPIKFPQLLLSIGICLGAGFIGSFFTFSAIPDWYATLNKPFFNPPNFIFGPVWTTLYIMMGISLYLIWISKSKLKQEGIRLFLIQLGFNVSWSIVFFGLRSPVFALVNIIALWITIFLTIKVFYPASRLAAYLLIPYLLWVSFAGILNLAIIVLN